MNVHECLETMQFVWVLLLLFRLLFFRWFDPAFLFFRLEDNIVYTESDSYCKKTHFFALTGCRSEVIRSFSKLVIF